MFAVVKTGGKQYRVAEGDVINVDRLTGEVGDKVTLDYVVMAGKGADVKTGSPLGGASVSAEITDQYRGDKVIVFKKKRRHNYRRKKGHRQYHTGLKITGIKA